MKFTSKQYAAALYGALSESRPEDEGAVLDNLVNVLKKNNQLNLAPGIEQEFLAIQQEEQGVKVVDVTSANELTGEQKHELVDSLNKYTGKKVELKEKVDEGLIGGMIVRYDDILMDGSIKKQLLELKNNLIK